MAALTENEIIDIVYELYETDDTHWETDSSEYLAARGYCNDAISRWEKYDNTVWRELFSTLTAAADGDKTITAGDYSYDCPTNFLRPQSWVRTGGNTLWEVVPPERVAELTDSSSYFCYFTGSVKDGFDLNFNPEITLNTGDTINYEYYKNATQFSATSSTTELSDPYFIVYSVLARFLKNDGEDYSEEANRAEELLENMRVTNMTGYFGIPDGINETVDRNYGFGL